MEVKVQLKHLIIVGLIVVYTFGSILFDLTNQLYNPTLNVAFIYDSLELGVENDANQVWEALNTIQTDFDFSSVNSHYDSIELQNVNLSGKMIDHIGEYAVKNEVVTVFGDSYNEEIDQVIESNPQTEFIMIDSEYGGNYPNLSTIEIDNTDRLDVVSKEVGNATKTQKVLFIGNSDDVNKQIDEFRTEINKTVDCNVMPLIFNDSSDNVAIKKKLLTEFNHGYDAVYVATRELNKIVIETAQEVQVDILDNRAEVDETNKQIKLQKENQSEIDETNTDETETDTDETETDTDETETGSTDETETDSTTDVDSSVEEDSEGEEIDSTTDEQDEAGLESTTNEDNDSDQIDEAESESANSELEYEEYKYEQDNINVFVNGYANISSGIYYTDDSETETSNVVRAYVDLNIEEVLFDMFKSILSGPFEHETIYLDFDNNGLELIEE